MKRGEPFNVLRDPNSWSSAPRAEAIAVSLFSGGLSGAAATAWLGTTAGLLATTGVSLALSVATSAIISALTPVPPSPKQSLLVNARDAAGPQEFVYGETRKGGTITYLETTRGGSVLYQVIALAAHEIESVEEIYINDEVATLSNDAYSNSRRSGAGWVTNRNWSDDPDEHEIRIFYHLGDQTAITDKFANSSVETLDSVFFDTGSSDEDSQNFGGVGQPTKASFVGNGIAYLFVRFSYAADVFKNGIPVITAKIRGKKVFDPRTSTTAYSNNAALCIRDFLTSAYGLSDPEVDDTVFQAAANTCDEAVTLDAGGTEARYTMNGVVRADQPYGDVLQEMVKSCAGTLFWGAGKWKLQPGEYNAPTKTFTLDDLRSEISLQTRVNLRDQFNRVQGVFSDANQRYIAADYPPIESATFKAQDGGVEQTLDLDLPFTTSAATAQRLAKMTLFRGREQMTFSAEFGLNAFDVEVGEIVALTIERYGWTGKEFEVVGWRFGANQDAGDLRVTLTLRETSSAAFDWNAEESDIIGNDSDLDNYNNDLTLSNLVASGGGKTQGDGTFINSCILSWDAPDNAYIARYDIQWKPTADSEYASTTTTETTAEISPLVDGVEYTFRVRAVSSRGNLGPFATVLFTGGGDTTGPSAPTSLTATGDLGFINLSWVNPPDADFNLIEVYEGPNATLGNATSIAKVASNTYNRGNLAPLTTRYYWVRALDFSGNASAFTGPVNATTRQITAADIGPAIITYDDFASDVTDLFDGIASDIGQLTTDTTALEADVTTLQTDYTSLSGTVSSNSTAISGLETRVTSAEGAITASASDITQLQTDLSNAETGISGNASAISGLDTRVTDNEGDISAQASAITSLSTTVGSNTTSITQALTSINGIEAKYGVTIDSNGSVTGFQLLSGSGGSAFNVRADQFAVFNSTGGGGDNPFTVFTSSRTINGVVYPAGTYIKDAYIDNAAIVNLSVDSAKIANLTVGTGKITDNAVTEMGASSGTIPSNISATAFVQNTADILAMIYLAYSGTGPESDSSAKIRVRLRVNNSTRVESFFRTGNGNDEDQRMMMWHGISTGSGIHTLTFESDVISNSAGGGISYDSIIATLFTRIK